MIDSLIVAFATIFISIFFFQLIVGIVVFCIRSTFYESMSVNHLVYEWKLFIKLQLNGCIYRRFYTFPGFYKFHSVVRKSC